MNKFKFRVWDTLAKRYFNSTDSLAVNHIFVNMNGVVVNMQNGSSGDELILQRYTGLKDKNGKPIYEGDIVKFSRLFEEDRKIKELTSCVRFDEGKFGFDLVGFNGMFFDLSDDCNIEVIGNIFENKDLLNA